MWCAGRLRRRGIHAFSPTGWANDAWRADIRRLVAEEYSGLQSVKLIVDLLPFGHSGAAEVGTVVATGARLGTAGPTAVMPGIAFILAQGHGAQELHKHHQ
ncbi:hypothetical protein GCM10009526_28390 [Glutamicibacter creatinolyticus]